MSDFRTIARTLAPHIDNVWTLLDATDDVLNLFPAQTEAPLADWERELLTGQTNHDNLVNTALSSKVVMDFMREGKKINAIKELRVVTGCSLKEGKNAVEDWRVDQFYTRNY